MFDILIALILLLITLPITFIAWLLLLIANNGKPFFFQTRPGMSSKLFKIVKFKTMNDATGPDGQLLPDGERLTPIGKLIRKTSFDELPQLVTVLKGDMSFVGPRPLLVEYLPLYNDVQSRRHEVKPGITGWAQVNGRNAISWERRFELDVWYVENQSFWLDLKILFLTFFKVLKSEGISSGNSVTKEKFSGSA